MKELSIEEKAKAYDEAIDKVAYFIKKHIGFGCMIHPNSSEAKELFNIFPEIKESEDDRIRKWIIDDIRYNMNNELLNNSEYKKKAEKAIAWLENKGYQKTVDKVRPKFNVGDWLVFKNKHQSIYQVEKIEDGYYILRHTHGGTFRVCILHDESLRLWTIQDAKDGDVLVNMFDDFIFIYNSTSILQAYCYYCSVRNRFIIEDRGHYCHWNMQEVKPATKEQRDLLFQKMKEAGYEWDDNKKKLKII